MNNTTLEDVTCHEEGDVYPFQNFVPTLVQCFLIVILGYLAARLQLLSSAEQRGVNAFVVWIGMPSIICVTLADADFGDMRWQLLLGLFMGKAVVFGVVASVALKMSGNVGIAGLLAVFCVQSNDLPVGNPLMSALYRNYRPQMMKYLFMMPAMTMIAFVPMGTLMIEMHKAQKEMSTGTEPATSWKTFLKSRGAVSVFRSLVKSTPVIVASALGVGLNFCFGGKMPPELHQSLKVLAATVPGCVLCVLGFNMVRKERYLLTSAIVTAAALLTVKMFVTPIVSHAVTRLLSDSSPSSKLLSDFALLYGIVSPATSIFLAGQEYRKPLAAMSAALIVSSFLSFPTSFFVARFTITTICRWDLYVPILRDTFFVVACFSLFCDVLVICNISYQRKWTTVPYNYVAGLVVTQVSTCLGVLVWCVGRHQRYTEMALLYGGEVSGLIWLSTTSLVFLASRQHPTLPQKKYTIITGVTSTACILFVALMCFLIEEDKTRSVYVLGSPTTTFQLIQVAAASCLQLLCLVTLGAALLSYDKTSQVCEPTKKCDFDNPMFHFDAGDVTATQYKRNRNQSAFLGLSFIDEEELYHQEFDAKDSTDNSKVVTEWTFRFFSLLLLLAISIFVKLVSNIYKLVNSNAFEVMIPLEFLQSSLFIGQGFFLLLTFGIDVRTTSIRIINWYRKIRYGREDFVTNASDNTDSKMQICIHFNTFYFEKCFKQLAKNRKWQDHIYPDCFWGHQLVDWMIQENLAEDDVEAEEIGHKLMEGGILKHITGTHHFHDAPYLYYFNRTHGEEKVE